MSLLCLLHLSMTSICVWCHSVLLCLKAAPAEILVGPECGYSCLSIARTSCSACLMDRSPESNENEQSCQASKLHCRKPEVKEVTASSFLDPRPELCKEAAASQTCLPMLKLHNVSEVTCSILHHTATFQVPSRVLLKPRSFPSS